MTTPQSLPRISKGSQFGDVTAAQWNNLVDIVERLARSLPDATLNAPPPPPDNIRRTRRVALVRRIESDIQNEIKVRTVLYREDRPPVSGDYVWGESFTAYPEVGVTPLDLAPFAWPELQPTIRTPILHARQDHEFWFVSPPMQAEKLVVLRAFGDDDPGSRFALVQEVRPILVDGAWTGAYESFGDAEQVNVWPTMVAGDFAPFMWLALQIDDRTTLLPLVFYAGVWYLKQRPKRAVVMRDGPIKTLDCSDAETS